MGLLRTLKGLARLGAFQSEETSREVGDLVEPGSTVEISGAAAQALSGQAAGLGQLEELRASGLIDADTLNMIETSMTNATAELDRLHASGAMSDEVYAQAMASMRGASAGSGSTVDEAELELLQTGESAPATILALPGTTDEASGRLPIKLEVHPAAGAAYEAECTVAAALAGELKVGNFLQVKVDPNDRKHVAVDWSSFGG